MRFTTFVASATLLFSYHARATKFLFNDPLKRDSINFIIPAPLEEINGQSTDIQGWMDLNENDLAASEGGGFVIQASSLTTGIPMRDQHMQDTYLDRVRFPEIKLMVREIKTKEPREKSIYPTKLVDREPKEVTLMSELSLHGVTRPVAIPAQITFFKESALTQAKYKGNLIHVRAGFEVVLDEHLIQRPQAVTMQIGEKAQVRASLTGILMPPNTTLIPANDKVKPVVKTESKGDKDKKKVADKKAAPKKSGHGEKKEEKKAEGGHGGGGEHGAAKPPAHGETPKKAEGGGHGAPPAAKKPPPSGGHGEKKEEKKEGGGHH